MSQRIVYNILTELKNATIDEIFNVIKTKKLTNANNRVKVRDSLILLSRQGVVKEANDKWCIVAGVEPHFRNKGRMNVNG
jgi:hypothetical protein